MGPRDLHRRQRRARASRRQHERNGVCVSSLVAAGGVAAGGCTAVPEGVYYGDDYVRDFDYFDGGDVEVADLGGGEKVCWYSVCWGD